jgi:hypothetical protein
MGQSVPNGYIFICHFCHSPTFFDAKSKQTPGASYGNAVSHIPDSTVEALYDESRDCMKVSAYTAAILCCRKLLMNIAVSRGAQQNLKFIDYVNYLSDQGYVPPNGKAWVDHIRSKGNEATHEIKIMNKDDAEDLIGFSEMLLKFIFEFPGKIAAKTPPAPAGPATPKT